jgi:hypothetical protein
MRLLSRWARSSGSPGRRYWPADGTHEFVGFHRMEAETGWAAVADRLRWRRAPVRPWHSVVAISAGDFALHVGRRDCRRPDCPTAPASPDLAGFGLALVGTGSGR